MKILLRLFVFVVFVGAGYSAIAQVNGSIDQRLIDMYGQSRVTQMQATQPELIEYLNYYVQNAYQVIYDLPQDKLFQFEDISTVTNTRTGLPLTEADLNNLNVMELSIRRKPDEHLTFKIGNTSAIAGVFGPREVHPKHEENSDKAILRTRYRMSPFSTIRPNSGS